MSVLDDIKQQYPTLAFLINDPEVGPLLRDAVDPNKGFSPQAFQAKLYQTKWFKSRSTQQRKIDILKNTDPAEYKRQYDQYNSQVKAMATKLGFNLTPAEIAFISGTYLRNGVEVGSDEFNQTIRNMAQTSGTNRFGQGSISGAMLQVQNMAHSQYYVAMTAADAKNWAVDLALGTKDENALRAMLATRAASQYTYLKDQLAAGQSMEDLFSGHRALIAQELELSPESVDFTKGVWNKVLHQVDPKTNQPRMMTLHETQTLARQQPEWWKTANGRKTDAGMANFMLKTFGKRA